jgi:hypothetical protein
MSLEWSSPLRGAWRPRDERLRLMDGYWRVANDGPWKVRGLKADPRLRNTRRALDQAASPVPPQALLFSC